MLHQRTRVDKARQPRAQGGTVAADQFWRIWRPFAARYSRVDAQQRCARPALIELGDLAPPEDVRSRAKGQAYGSMMFFIRL